MRDDLEDGFAMIMVLITTLVVTAAVTLSLTIATQDLPAARHDQDWNAALAAAQAGVDDYRRHLDDNDTYWTNGGVDASNPAFVSTGGRTIPGSSGSKATYRYRLLTSVAQTQVSGLIRLRSTGTVNNVSRTVTVDLRKAGFLKYSYLENFSTVDPSLYDPSSQYYNSNTCRQYYDSRPSGCSQVSPNPNNLIGPYHSNDAVWLNGNPTFTSPIAESSYPHPNGVKAGQLVTTLGSGSENSAGYQLIYAPIVAFPPTNTQIQLQTVSPNTGCLYTGPTRIILNSDGTMTVTSPNTKSTNPGCSTSLPMTSAQTVSLPSNGVVYVQNIPASTSDPNYSNITCASGAKSILGLYPQTGDNQTTYNCHNGDVFLEGTLKGQLTIASANDIVATNNILYAGGHTGTDVLGLVANNYVTIMHPVSCTGNQSGSSCVNLPVVNGQPLYGVEIDAAILSLTHTFTLQNYDEGPALSTPGTLSTYRHPFGAVITYYSAVDGTSSNGVISTGMSNNYEYDPRLLTQPPPYFLQPLSATWDVVAFDEDKPGS